MDPLDWVLLLIRWSHSLAAVAWVGGGIFYLMVLRPALRRTPIDGAARQSIGAEFRSLVHTGIAVLLITGAILSASRLTQDTISLAYVIILAVKVLLALYMFYVVRFMRPRGYPDQDAADAPRRWRFRDHLTGTTALLVLGVAIFGLADVLTLIFENSLVE